MDRLAQDQGALTRLQRDTAIELVTERLAAVAELREASRALGESEALWPLQRNDIEKAIGDAGIPARELLKHCRDRFDEWRRGYHYASRGALTVFRDSTHRIPRDAASGY